MKRCDLEAPAQWGPIWGFCSHSPETSVKTNSPLPARRVGQGLARSRAEPRTAAGEHGEHGEDEALPVASTERSCLC